MENKGLVSVWKIRARPRLVVSKRKIKATMGNQCILKTGKAGGIN